MHLFYAIFLIPLVFLGFGFFSSSFVRKEKVKRFLLALFFFLGILLLFVFRNSGVGIDTETYYEFYLNSKNYQFLDLLSGKAPFETGFSLFCFFFSSCNVPFPIFLFFCAFLIFIPPILIINKYSPYPALSYLILYTFGFFTFSMSALRQSIAIGLFLIGFLFYNPKRPVSCFLILPFILLALSFHTSAIVCFLVFLVLFPWNETKRYLYFKYAILVIYFFCDRDLYFLFYNVSQQFPISSLKASSPPPSFFDIPQTVWVYLIIMIFFDLLSFGRFSLISILKNNSDVPNDKEKLSIFSVFLFFQIIFLYTGNVTTSLPRAGYFFFLGFPIILSFLLRGIKPKFRNVGFVLSVVFCVFYFFYFQVLQNSLGVFCNGYF